MKLTGIKRENWWLSIWGDSDHNADHFEKFITPYIAFIPWHRSVLASIPNYCETFSVTVEVGWWCWRARFTYGRSKKLTEV